MCYRLLFSILCVLVASSGLGAADRFVGLQFTDGQARTEADFKGQGLVVAYFCSHCPNARAFLKGEAKKLVDTVESEQLPSYVVLITPEYKGQELASLQKSLGLEHALVAHDAKNVQQISLNNILQCFAGMAGAELNRVNNTGLAAAVKPLLASGKHRISRDGLSDEKALTLWWMLERGQAEIIPTLVKMAKAKSASQADCQKLLDVVQGNYDSRLSAITAKGVSIDAYDELESLITNHQGLETKPAVQQLKALSKEDALDDELKARSIWFKIQELLQSNKPKDQETGAEGLKQLSARYPETKYGKLAGG